MSEREELLAAGRRAAYKNQCKSVLVAPDHTGDLNYHNCSRRPDHTGAHVDSGGYEWIGDGTYGGRTRESGIIAAPGHARPKLHYVARDGKQVSPYFVDENDAAKWLQDHQAQSNDWATKHEGYSFEGGE